METFTILKEKFLEILPFLNNSSNIHFVTSPPSKTARGNTKSKKGYYVLLLQKVMVVATPNYNGKNNIIHELFFVMDQGKKNGRRR